MSTSPDRALLAFAVYAFASHYHSGQASRGYRLACRARAACRRYFPRAPDDLLGRAERELRENPRGRVATIYRRLQARYRDRM